MAPMIVLNEFLKSAIEELKALRIDKALPLPQIRALLLERQSAALESVVQDYNTKHKTSITMDDVQISLKRIADDDPLIGLNNSLNETARLTYARLALYSACRLQVEQSLQEQMALKASGGMERKVLMDLFALCQTAVRLPFVKDHVARGTPLFEFQDSTQKDSLTPPKRLERIQGLFLRVLGYDTSFGTEEIKRIFFSQEANEFSDDSELRQTFNEATAAMSDFLTKATLEASVSNFSDIESGGVTRVVSVDFSEKVLDDSGNVVGGDMPRAQVVAEQAEAQQRQQLRVASQAAKLQQEIIDELLSMPKKDRDAKLLHAKRVSDDFLRCVMEKPPGPERVQVLRSIDEPTQRLMAMHKLWEGLLASNGGKEPDGKIRHRTDL